MQVVVVPARLERALARLDDRLGEELDALGPLGQAWQRARHGFDDALSTLDAATPDQATAWGLHPDAPVSLDWSAGGFLAKAFLSRLAGRAGPTGGVVWQARLRVAVADAAALQARLARLAIRLDWKAPAERWVLRGVRWQALGSEGLWVGLRVQGGEGAIDLIRVHGDVTRARVAEALARARPPAAAPTQADLVIQLQPAGLGAVEAAQAAAVGLEQPTRDKQVAVAEVLSTCVEAWSQLAALAPATTHAVDVPLDGVHWRVEAGLSPAAVRAWDAAQGTLPLGQAGPEPAGYQIALHPRSFPDPGLAVLDRCPWIPSVLRVLAAPAAAPALLGLGDPPQPAPPSGWGRGRPTAVAALVLGAGGARAAPHLGAVRVGVQLGDAPLGARATRVEDTDGVRWVLGGAGLAVSAAQRTVAGQAVALFGIGPDAALRLGARLAEPADASGQFFEAWLRPGALADALVSAGLGGPEVQALRAVAARLGALRLQGVRRGAALQLQGRWGELDHPPGGK